ncbi:hypothetical protein ACEPAG_9689 [Sanghuangporus baumii]
MTSSKPRIHKDLDHHQYTLRSPKEKNLFWDMRYDPRDRNNQFREPRFPYHFNYYGPRTMAFIPRVERLCVLFRYHRKVPHYWVFDIVHYGPPSPQDGYAITAEDVVSGIYDQLQLLPSHEDVAFSKEHNKLADQARLERCELFGLDKSREPVRRIDYIKGVQGGCAFAGLDNYDRHLATPMMRIYTGEITPRSF